MRPQQLNLQRSKNKLPRALLSHPSLSLLPKSPLNSTQRSPPSLLTLDRIERPRSLSLPPNSVRPTVDDASLLSTGMGDEGPAAEPYHTRKRPRDADADAGDMKRVAEIVMVLSTLGQMRGGKEPTAAENALVAEARERLVGMCEAVKPKELFSREAVRVVVEDLGLNRSKDPVLGFRPPKMSIADKLLLTKKKMEESKEARMQPSVYSPQQYPLNFVGRSEPLGVLAHDSSRFMHDKNSMVTSSGASQSASSISHVPVLPSTSSSMKQSHISDVNNVNHVKQSSGSLEKGSLVCIGLSARPSKPSHLTQDQAESMPPKIPTISSVPSTSATVGKLGQPNKSFDHGSTKPEGATGVNAVQSSQHPRYHETKSSVVQTGQGGLHIAHQPPQGMTIVHTPSLFTNHSDIVKSVQRILLAKASDHPSWIPPSTEYMNATLNCQICKIGIMDTESLLVCDACEKGNHLKCLQSYGNKGIPKAEWHCPRCLAATNGKPLPPKYGRVTRAPVGTVPKAAPNASTPVPKKAEDLESKLNQQKTIANNNTCESDLAYSLEGGNSRESIPDSTANGAEFISNASDVKRDDGTCNSIGGNYSKETAGFVSSISDFPCESHSVIENDSLASADTKPASEPVLQPPTIVPENTCEQSQSMLVESNHLSKISATQDSYQLELASNVKPSANNLHEISKTLTSEPHEVHGEEKLPECMDVYPSIVVTEGSSTLIADESKGSFI